MTAPESLKILAPPSTIARLSRRGLLSGAALAALGGGALAACGKSTSSGGATTTVGAKITYGTGPVESGLNIYTWGEYDSPDVLKGFTTKLGPKITIDSYGSNEEMIAKLAAAKGTAGYDIIVPTGPYIPQMSEQGLVMELNLDAIPNFKNLEASFTKQPWDPTNKYTVCKDWGTTGYAYNKTVIKRELTTWADFTDAAKNEASGQMSLLDDPQELMGIWAFANGKDWSTKDPADLDAAEAYIIDLAKHAKAFVSYPSNDMPTGKYSLVHAWNGDARQGILNSKNPDIWQWVFPGPKSTLWMDNWSIPTGAKNVNAAHAFINYILDVDNSLAEIGFHGYHTGLSGIVDKAKAQNFKRLDMVFFTQAQIDTMVPGTINESLQRRVDILNKAKAAAGA